MPLREAKDQDVLNGFLAEIMIDAIDLRFLENLADFAVQRLRRFEIAAEGLLDDDAAPVAVLFAGQTLLAQLPDDFRNELRQRREVIKNVALRVVLRVEFGDLVFELDEVGGVVEVAGDVVRVVGDPVAERAIGRRAGVLADVVARPLAEILFGEFVFRETEDGELAAAAGCCGARL